MYHQDLVEAAERTHYFGLCCPSLPPPSGWLLTAEKYSQFPYAVQAAVGDLNPSQVVAQCLSIHLALKAPLERFFSATTIYTIGYIELSDSAMFKQSERELWALLQNGIKSPHLQLHAWLTLPSDEIIDVSIATSIAFFQKLEKGWGGAIASHADDLTGMTYRPMLLGEDFLKKIGALIEL